MIRRDQEIYDNNAPITGVIIWVCKMAQAYWLIIYQCVKTHLARSRVIMPARENIVKTLYK